MKAKILFNRDTNLPRLDAPKEIEISWLDKYADEFKDKKNVVIVIYGSPTSKTQITHKSLCDDLMAEFNDGEHTYYEFRDINTLTNLIARYSVDIAIGIPSSIREAISSNPFINRAGAITRANHYADWFSASDCFTPKAYQYIKLANFYSHWSVVSGYEIQAYDYEHYQEDYEDSSVTLGFELELDKFFNSLEAVLYDEGFVPSCDATCAIEYKSPIYDLRSIHSFFDRNSSLLDKASIQSMHLHVRLNEDKPFLLQNINNMSYLREKLLRLIYRKPIERIGSREPTVYCEKDETVHRGAVYFYTSNNTIEFRFPTYRHKTQYLKVIELAVDLTRWIQSVGDRIRSEYGSSDWLEDKAQILIDASDVLDDLWDNKYSNLDYYVTETSTSRDESVSQTASNDDDYEEAEDYEDEDEDEEPYYDSEGYDQWGFDREGFDREGFDADGFNEAGYDSSGYDSFGIDMEGFDRQGFDADGFDRDGYNRNGYDQYGFQRDGFNAAGYGRDGYNRDGYNVYGYNREGKRMFE